MYCGKGMELASAGCADCCSDCANATPACCGPSSCCNATATACCVANCQLLPSDAISYEYQEPEENFVSIDDAKIKSLLLKIGQQQQLELQRQQQEHMQLQRQQQQQQQVIELLDDDETCVEQTPLMVIGAARSLKHTKRVSPDIQLIPKQQEPQRIVARIELSDSECEDENVQNAASEDDANEDDYGDEDNLPLAAVSCELREPAQVILVQSDDDEQLQEKRPKLAPVKRPPRPYIKRRGRNFYQCQACGKKVQSNYNLRRHMMIHTGERPFPCDLCERRFREFSDLKKHRRRHFNDPRYICMICRIHPPMEQDSTRCVECEGKNLLLNPQGCDMEMDEENSPSAAGNDKVQDENADEQQETDQEELLEEGVAPATSAALVSKSPMLLVTLVPTMPKLTHAPAASVTATATATPVAATPSRPPLPRSCSSANSSSSYSNEAAPRRPSRTTRNRRSYPCPLCHRPFGTRHNLKRHYMIHTGEKPFSCTKCRKPFRECSTLKKHMVTHVRDRWYKCLRCPSKFQDYLHYTEHKALHGAEQHIDARSSNQHTQHSSDSDDADSSVEDWLECCECNRRFTQLDAYTAHLKQHDLELYGMSVDDVDDDEQDVDVA